MATLLPEELQVFSRYIYEVSGIYLDASKAYLIESRFNGILREMACSSFSELYFKAKSDPKKVIQEKIISAISTGETMFFRDHGPFDLLQHKILPDLIDKRKSIRGASTAIRIWSAACSSGQEVYSIAIILKELLGDMSRYQLTLLGTDISDAAIRSASSGNYNKFEIERGLPKDKRARYFSQEMDSWKINDEIRSLATFKKVNLMENFNGLGKFDIVLCRNVAIYFTEQDKIALFKKIGAVMEPDGYLIIGSTESLAGLCPQYEPRRHLRSVFYQLKANGNSSYSSL